MQMLVGNAKEHKEEGRNQRIMRRILLLVTVAAMMAALMAASALPAFADRVVTGDDVNVHSHQHFIITPNGEEVAVGPKACGTTEPSNQEGFDQFHVNVHDPALAPGGDSVTNPATPNQFAFRQENNPVGFKATRC